MIARTYLSSFSALLLLVSTGANSSPQTSIASKIRDLQYSNGVNLCAAYTIVVPMIEGGEDNCECDGRTIVCKFESLCNAEDNSQCAKLYMKIDFTQAGEEIITYSADYGNTFLKDGSAFSDMKVDLEVAPNVEGIEGCSAIYGDSACECSVCAEGRGIDINCESYQSGAITKGCTIVDVGNFERFVPFFETNGGMVAQSVSASTSSSAVTFTASVALAIVGSFAIAMAA